MAESHTVDDFLDLLPAHKVTLYLTHNEHKSYYETVEKWASDIDRHWISEDERQKAVERDNVWTIQWYPETPVGSHSAAASDLAILMAWLQEIVDA